MDQLLIATIVGFSILIASMLSVEIGLSVAIIEIAFGVVAGNAFGVTTTPWIDFLASFAGIVLTFLAGAEVDPSLLRRKLKESLLIGGVSFLLPFACASPRSSSAILSSISGSGWSRSPCSPRSSSSRAV